MLKDTGRKRELDRPRQTRLPHQEGQRSVWTEGPGDLLLKECMELQMVRLWLLTLLSLK